jgi:hypothetical protein
MKAVRYLFLIMLLFSLGACQDNKKDEQLPGEIVNNPLSADNPGDPSKMPFISFEKTDYDFGRIYEGERVKCVFKFKNTGQSDLIITSAKGSCGCTVPEYPETPIKPGEGGNISVEFNSSGRKGQQNKAVTVTTNAQPPTVVLSVKAMVVEP